MNRHKSTNTRNAPSKRSKSAQKLSSGKFQRLKNMFVKQNIHTKTFSPQCAIVPSRESQYPCIQFMKRHHPSICVLNYFLNSLLNDILYLLQITPEKKLATRKLDELLKQQKKKNENEEKRWEKKITCNSFISMFRVSLFSFTFRL